jgi:mRNA-degrading endonuclease RelE of RelBE toxin-antitoxin system
MATIKTGIQRNPPHKWRLVIRPEAKTAFDALQLGEKQGVFRRLRELLNADNPYALPFVEMLKDKKFERVRKFRVGDIRVFFVVDSSVIQHLQHTYAGTLVLLDVRIARMHIDAW